MLRKNKVGKAVKIAIAETKQKSDKDEVDKMLSEQNWEELNNLYMQLAKGIIDMGQYLSACLQEEEVFKYLEDPDHIKTLVKCLTKDLVSFSEELKEIGLQHKDKTGPLLDENELFICVNIYQEYQSLETKLFSVITPLHMEVLTTLNDANQKRLKAKELNEEVSEGEVVTTEENIKEEDNE